MFLHQGKPCGVAIEQWFDAKLVDVSRRGIRVETPWPLSIGDTLMVELVGANGQLVARSARVVRPGRRAHGAWQSGLSFVNHNPQLAAA
jgi:hypothetical protein